MVTTAGESTQGSVDVDLGSVTGMIVILSTVVLSLE